MRVTCPPDAMTVRAGSGHNVEISLLHHRDAHVLAPLLANYAQALKRGAPRRPDDFYAEPAAAGPYRPGYGCSDR